jgi:hypothetical protein
MLKAAECCWDYISEMSGPSWAGRLNETCRPRYSGLPGQTILRLGGAGNPHAIRNFGLG